MRLSAALGIVLTGLLGVAACTRPPTPAPTPDPEPEPAPAAGEAGKAKVKLAVLVVFDQMRGDYLEKALPVGQVRVVSGRVERYEQKLQMVHPDHILPLEDVEALRTIEPVYGLTEGLSLKVLTKDADAIEHLDELLALARLPNVAVKATGAPAYSTQPYPFRNLHDPLHRIFDAFGPDRFFWGTDITRMPCSYRQCVTFFTEELPWLRNGQDLEKVMGRGLARWIGWDFRF